MPAQAIQADAPSALANLALALAQPNENGLRALGDEFYTPVAAAALPDPVLVGYSADAGRLLGLPPDAGATPEFLALFSGNNSRAEAPAQRPIATVYSGHQFGVWAGQLGDGRALLLGEAGPPDARYEVQLKGAGLTPYSRMGDGRAVLRSSIREFLCSEAMHHLGVPTTRALSVIGSPLPVRRETIETAAVVTRLAPSFVRFGHFEHFYAARRTDLMQKLAMHVIDRHFPHCRQAADPVLALFGETLDRTAAMIAQWQGVGFCHGVMNTDNMSILGLTIDYGPFGFLDAYDAKHICNHTDTGGRYAYGMQPRVAHWNLFCLAQVLLPLIGAQRGAAGDERAVDDVQNRLETFPSRFEQAYTATMQAKLGLGDTRDGDAALVTALFEAMQQGGADFTLTFRHLCDVASHDASRDAPVRDLFLDRSLADAWLAQYRARLRAEDSDDARRAAAMKRVNPLYVLRNHLAEVAIRRAAQHDFSEVARLLEVLRHPFDEQPGRAAYAALPPAWATSLEVSCSS